MFTPSEVLDEIQTELTNIAIAHREDRWPLESRGETAWTRLVLERVGKLGHQQGYYVCTKKAHYLEANHGEWMFDQCWLRYKDGTPLSPLLNLPLILECEWDKDIQGIKHDFEKLIVTKAQLKVLVCQQNSGVEIEALLNKMEEWIRKFDPDCLLGQYLLCCYLDNPEFREFRFRQVG